MTQAAISVLAFLALLLALPVLIRWVQRRIAVPVNGAGSASRLVSAVAVGPHQRVVTVEVGPPEARVWLVLGVTNQTVSCLHTLPVASVSGLDSVLPSVERQG